MKLNYNFLKYFTYIILFILAIFIICYSFSFKQSLVKTFNLNKKKFSYSSTPIYREGFEILKNKDNNNSNTINSNNIGELMFNKVKGLVEEIGGKEGKQETITILKNTKKVCNLECAKCMMKMIDNSKSLKTIDVDNLLFNEDDENCIKCKKYTELSNTIQNMIDNL